jgi:hypothetical protein
LPISDEESREVESMAWWTSEGKKRRGRGDGKDGWLYMPQREKELKEKEGGRRRVRGAVLDSGPKEVKGRKRRKAGWKEWRKE